jgi:hypothetical protein
MDMGRTDQKRDHETGHWVSDLQPGATADAKLDKGVEDTFPASDPAPKSGATGFITPDGRDTARRDPDGSERPDAAEEPASAGQVSVAAIGQHPLAVLLVAGAMGWMLGLLANSRR